MARDLSSVLDLDGLTDRLVDEDVTEVYLLLGEVCFGTQSFTFEFEWQPFFSTRDIAVSHAIVGVGLEGHKSDSNGDLAVGPDFSNKRLNLEDAILEEEQIVFNGFLDSLVFSGEGQLSTFPFAFQELPWVDLLL